MLGRGLTFCVGPFPFLVDQGNGWRFVDPEPWPFLSGSGQSPVVRGWPWPGAARCASSECFYEFSIAG